MEPTRPDPTSKHTRRHHNFESFKPSVIPRYPDLNSMYNEDSAESEDVEEYVVAGRKFTWKILSYSQCTRTCGGGIQVSLNFYDINYFDCKLYYYIHDINDNFSQE